MYGGLLLCVLLKPAGLAANDGISYFGIFRVTFVPYAIGLLGSAYFCRQTANNLRGSNLGPVRLVMSAVATLTVIIVLTPYAAGRWVDDTHTTCGSILFILQLLLSGWLIVRLRYIWWSIALSLAELAGGILSAIYLGPLHGFLFQSQVLFQLAFGTLLVLSLRALPVPASQHVS